MDKIIKLTESEAEQVLKLINGEEQLINEIKKLILTKKIADKILQIIEVSFAPVKLKRKIFDFVNSK